MAEKVESTDKIDVGEWKTISTSKVTEHSVIMLSRSTIDQCIDVRSYHSSIIYGTASQTACVKWEELGLVLYFLFTHRAFLVSQPLEAIHTAALAPAVRQFGRRLPTGRVIRRENSLLSSRLVTECWYMGPCQVWCTMLVI